ncbi:unnamed protein product [Trichobilharzia szidati]|nr:unnamed protein product [Trichobilharzia szidati]
MSRFRDIFLSEKDLFTFLVPGDNDVGGEGVSVTDARLSRFYGSFPAKSTQQKCKFVNFYSDNMPSGKNIDIQSEKSPEEINVFISHFPVATQYHTWFPIKLLQSSASLCIHGHLHRSQVIHWKNSKGSENSEANVSFLQAANFIRTPREPLHFKLTDSVHYVKFSSEPTLVETLKAYGELISIGVPSCTYRSGFPHLNGIGLLQIYRNKSVTYSVLPLYNRYYTLFFYALLTTTLIGLQFISYSVVLIFKLRFRRNMFIMTASTLLVFIIYFECDYFIDVGKLF